MIIDRTASLLASALLLAACGGGSGDGGGAPPVLSDGAPSPGSAEEPPGGTVPPDVAPAPDGTPTPDETSSPDGAPPPDTTPPAVELPADAPSASYAVTLESLWFAEDYPQGFPEDAHLSHIGGATHNAAVSFWEPGGIVSRGMEDVAETGRIELFLAEEVTPAIENGTADSAIALREFTFSSPETFALGLPNETTFELEIEREWPRVTLVTMLGPSPDWFVGVDGLPLHEDGAWHDALTVELPLYDGGSKSDLVPEMGGTDIIPPIPIELIAYDEASGVYVPSATPQTLARLRFVRTR